MVTAELYIPSLGGSPVAVIVVGQCGILPVGDAHDVGCDRGSAAAEIVSQRNAPWVCLTL
jgi:hypothetical protein